MVYDPDQGPGVTEDPLLTQFVRTTLDEYVSGDLGTVLFRGVGGTFELPLTVLLDESLHCSRSEVVHTSGLPNYTLVHGPSCRSL